MVFQFFTIIPDYNSHGKVRPIYKRQNYFCSPAFASHRTMQWRPRKKLVLVISELVLHKVRIKSYELSRGLALYERSNLRVRRSNAPGMVTRWLELPI